MADANARFPPNAVVCPSNTRVAASFCERYSLGPVRETSMTHLTECPACRHELQVPPELLGQLVKCPMCAKTFTAPATFVDASSQNLTPPSVPPPFHPAHAETIESPSPTPVAPVPPKPRSGFGFRCPYCKSTARTVTRSQISVAGWIVFAIMLAFCFPLFWIGLLMTEEVKVCGDCGNKLSETGI